MKLRETYYTLGAAMTVGMLVSPGDAHAGETFSKVANNITTSIQDVPGMLSGVSYLVGILLGTLGVLKIKDHVENPGQTPIKEGAIRLAAGGALLALPMIFEAMFSTIGTGTQAPVAALNKAKFVIGG